MSKVAAKEALDKILSKTRIHFYKPIQIAEILYRIRQYGDINPLNLEEYRNESKRWRDEISIQLLGRRCTSSARFQDDLFNDNAIPPEILNTLSQENLLTGGAVEAYIYRRFTNKHNQLFSALSYCRDSDKSNFSVINFINSFWNEPGLKRSLDKIYEIVVYALFSALVESLNLKVELSVDESKFDILNEFKDFSHKVMCLDMARLKFVQDAKIYRVGVTNAADRGLDMYSNWGVAIQIKHLSLDTTLAENIVSNISSNRIIIVCKDAEQDIIVSLMTQIGWRSRIQSIVTETDLINWYEKALRGKHADIVGDKLMETLCSEIAEEFPSVTDLPVVLKSRHYENITNSFWE